MSRPASGPETGPIVIGNEFSEIRVSRVEGRNGARLLIESTRSGHRVELCPLELEALTWQDTRTFTELIAHPMASLFSDAAGDPGNPRDPSDPSDLGDPGDPGGP